MHEPNGSPQDVLLQGHHLSVSEMAAYLEWLPPGPTRDRVEAHLSRCDCCRRDVIAVGRVLRADAARSR